MSATAVRPGGTIAMTLPVPMIPGPLGADSPAVLTDVPRYRWYSWIDLSDDRDARRASTLPVIEWALGHAIGAPHDLWWLAPATDRWEVHNAGIEQVVDGGLMLLAACRRSTPWTGPNENVTDRLYRHLPDDVPACPICQIVTP